MGPPRLLPVVIFASLALLGFKGIGLVTGTGYVLGGTAAAQAADAGTGGGASVADTAPRTEPTANDTAPTLADTTPTLVPAAAPAAPDAGKTAAAAAEATDIPPPQVNNATAAAVEGGGTANAAQDSTIPVCPPDTPKPSGAMSMDAVTAAAAAAVSGNAPPKVVVPTPGLNCDAAVQKVNDAGDILPLIGDGGKAPNATEQTILARLSQRRSELDKREADLQVREATVQAAEQQLQVRTDALKALEAKLQQLDDDRKAANDAQFAALVKMYETMKPQEAAVIFDGLDMDVLTRVAKAMDPRKMSPVLAKMSSVRAQALTAALAQPVPGVTEQAAATAALDPNALPQIVGH